MSCKCNGHGNDIVERLRCRGELEEEKDRQGKKREVYHYFEQRYRHRRTQRRNTLPLLNTSISKKEAVSHHKRNIGNEKVKPNHVNPATSLPTSQHEKQHPLHKAPCIYHILTYP